MLILQLLLGRHLLLVLLPHLAGILLIFLTLSLRLLKDRRHLTNVACLTTSPSSASSIARVSIVNLIAVRSIGRSHTKVTKQALSWGRLGVADNRTRE